MSSHNLLTRSVRLARSSSFRTSWALLGDFLGDGVDERVQVDAFVFLKALANSGEMTVKTVADVSRPLAIAGCRAARCDALHRAAHRLSTSTDGSVRPGRRHAGFI